MLFCSVPLIRIEAPWKEKCFVLLTAVHPVPSWNCDRPLLDPKKWLLEKRGEGLGSRGPCVPGCKLETLSCEQ